MASRFSERYLPYVLGHDLDAQNFSFHTPRNATKSSSEQQYPTPQWLWFEITPLDRTGDGKFCCLPMMAIPRAETQTIVI